MIVNISEAKKNLSKLVDMAYHGEEVIIAKNNLPLVEFVRHQPNFSVGGFQLAVMAGIMTKEYTTGTLQLPYKRLSFQMLISFTSC